MYYLLKALQMNGLALTKMSRKIKRKKIKNIVLNSFLKKLRGNSRRSLRRMQILTSGGKV